jgi:hypothetical protein
MDIANFAKIYRNNCAEKFTYTYVSTARMSSELRVVQVTHSPIASCATVSATAVGAACSAHEY